MIGAFVPLQPVAGISAVRYGRSFRENCEIPQNLRGHYIRVAPTSPTTTRHSHRAAEIPATGAPPSPSNKHVVGDQLLHQSVDAGIRGGNVLVLPRRQADRIVEYRQHNRFEREVDLTEVKGIGPKMFERLRPYLKVNRR